MSRVVLEIDESVFAEGSSETFWREERRLSRFEAWLDLVTLAGVRATAAIPADSALAGRWAWDSGAVKVFLSSLQAGGQLNRSDGFFDITDRRFRIRRVKGKQKPEQLTFSFSGAVPEGTVWYPIKGATEAQAATHGLRPTAGGWEFPINPAKLAEWQELYPDMDVEFEVKRSAQYRRDKPGRKPTIRGVHSAASNYLSIANDSGRYRRLDRPKVSYAFPKTETALRKLGWDTILNAEWQAALKKSDWREVFPSWAQGPIGLLVTRHGRRMVIGGYPSEGRYTWLEPPQ